MALSTASQSYLEGYEAFAALGAEPPQLVELRSHARERFEVLGFPSVLEEEWRFTNVAPLARSGLENLVEAGSVSATQVDALSYDGCDRLVFVDGRVAPEHCTVERLPDGAFVGSLRQALSECPDLVLEHLGRHAPIQDRAFSALNTALFVDGAAILAPKGSIFERPIHLLFIASESAEGRAFYPRNLVVAGEASQLTIVESYAGLCNQYFNCVVSEFVGEQSSHFDHYRLQRESRASFHIATVKTWLDRSAVFSSYNLALGGGLVRVDTGAMLDGEGIECTLNGLYIASDDQLIDNHMRVEHKKPHCNSHELYKGILDGRARAVFNGRIFVHQDAQKTDAKQTNRNLLLSREALVNSNPQLEIFADDVRCTHGSTVGQLDEEAVFYLRSRGIEEEAARSLLTYAFANEVAEGIRLPEVRQEVEEFLFNRLAAGEIVRQAV